MSKFSPVKKSLIAAAALTSAIALPSLAHIEKSEPLQSLRQSYFALVGMTFGPMADMVKGNIPWDDATFTAWSKDLAALTHFSVERGFAPGSEGGKTRAKPEIWLDTEDFNNKLAAFKTEAQKLATAAESGDAAAIKTQFGATGKTCKGCHDEYKSKDYL